MDYTFKISSNSREEIEKSFKVLISQTPKPLSIWHKLKLYYSFSI